MHICHINLASEFYGGENQTFLMIKKQIEFGIQVTIVCKKNSPFALKIRNLNCNKIEIAQFLFGHISSLSLNFDMIHVHEGKALYWALIQNFLRKKNYIITRRIDKPIKNRLFLKIGYKRSSYIVGLSNKIKEIIKLKFPTKKITVIPSSPDKKSLNENELTKLQNLTKDQFVIIQVGKLLKIKGYETSIEVAKKIKKIIPNVHFYFLGDGPEESNLRRLINDEDFIHLMGYQANTTSWYKVSDIQIHPSLHEGLGGSILEGLLNGTNVIASNVGGIPDIIQNNINGLLFESNNAQDLSKKIQYLYENPMLTKKFFQNNKKILKKFDINYTCKQYIEIYKEVLSNKKIK